MSPLSSVHIMYTYIERICLNHWNYSFQVEVTSQITFTKMVYPYPVYPLYLQRKTSKESGIS